MPYSLNFGLVAIFEFFLLMLRQMFSFLAALENKKRNPWIKRVQSYSAVMMILFVILKENLKKITLGVDLLEVVLHRLPTVEEPLEHLVVIDRVADDLLKDLAIVTFVWRPAILS